MRALVLAVAVVLSLGSAHDAKTRHGVRSASCGTIQDPAEKQICFNNANTHYLVESNQELAGQQQLAAAGPTPMEQQMAADQQVVDRCEHVVAKQMECDIVMPSDAAGARDYCLYTMRPAAPRAGYGRTVCMENATTCERMNWCLAH